MKKDLMKASLLIATVVVALSSCQKNVEDLRQDPQPNVESASCKVEAKSFELRSNGDLVPISVTSLRGEVSTEKGTITGLGEYNSGATVVVKATKKGDYKLYSFYEANNNGGFTKEAGKANVDVNQAGKKIVKYTSAEFTFNVESDMHFIAVFTKAGDATPEYSIDEVGGNNKDFSAVYNPKGETKTFPIVGKKKIPIVAPDGTVEGYEEQNFTAWDVKTSGENWVTAANNPEGTLTVTADNYKSKTGKRRSSQVTIYKGTESFVHTVYQDSWYVDNSDNGEGGFAGGDGTAVSDLIELPESVTYAFNPKGEKKNITTVAGLEPLAKPIWFVKREYKNGEVIKILEKVKVSISYGTPSQSWMVKETMPTVKALRNGTGSSRTSVMDIVLKVGNKTVKTIRFTGTQATDSFIVDGEIL